MVQTPPKGNGPFIFLAEDDIDDQELLIEALSEIDDTITVRTVTNGKKAISFLQELPADQQPCLIILDFNLPELSGADVLEQLKRARVFDEVIKIVWSTSNSPVYEKLCLDLGAKAYIVKPTDITGIQHIAHTMLQMCSIK